MEYGVQGSHARVTYPMQDIVCIETERVKQEEKLYKRGRVH